MTTAKPVPDQVLLTSTEMYNLTEGLRNLVTDNAIRKQVIRTVVASLNKWRFGAPAGETRRSDNGSLAVRVQGPDDALGWDVVRLEDGDEATVEAIERWKVVHPESWYERAVDADYTKDDK